MSTALGGFRLHYPLITLATVNFFFYADRYILFILVEPIRAEFGLSDKDMGLLTGLAFGISYCLFAIPLGRLADRSSRVVMIALAALGWSAATIAFAFSISYPQMIALRSAVAIGEAAGYIAIQSIVADLYAPEKRVRAMAVVFGSGMAGMIFAYSAVGAISEAHGWRSGFLFLGIIGIGFGPLFYASVREPARGATEGVVLEVGGTTFRAAIVALWRRKSFVFIILGYMAASVASFAMMAWLPAFLLRRFELSLAKTGLLASVGSLGPMLLGLTVAGLVSERLYRRNQKWVLWLPAIGMLLAAVFQVIQVSTSVLLFAVAAGAVPAFISGIYIPPLMAAMQSVSGARLRGTAAAITALAVILMGQGVGPALVGALSHTLGSVGTQESFVPLQRALVTVCSLYFLTSLLLLAATRFMHGDIEMARRFDEAGY